MTGSNLSKRLFTGTFNYGVGSVIQQLIGFFLLPVYTAYLLPADYGIVEMVTIMGAFLATMMRLGITGSVSRFYYDHKDNPEELKDYLTTINRTRVLGGLAVAGIAAVILYFFSEELVGDVDFFPYLFIGILVAFLSSNSELQRRLLQSMERAAYSARLNIATSLITVGLSLWFIVVLKLKAEGFLLATLISAIIFFIQARIFLRPYLKGKYNREMNKSSVKYGLGLLPHHLLTVANPLFIRSFLATSASLASVGIFSIAYRFYSPAQLLYTTFNSAFQPIYFGLRKECEEKEEKIESIFKLFDIIWLGSVLFFSCFVIIMPHVVIAVMPDIYHPAVPLIPILCLGFPAQVLYMLFGSEVLYLRKTSLMPLITLANIGVTIIIAVSLGGRFMEVGLAYATSIGYIVSGVMSFYFFKKHSPLSRYPLKKIIFGLWIVVLVLVYSIQENIHSLTYNILILILIVFLIWRLSGYEAKMFRNIFSVFSQSK
jgi:O-antigen/teichoic acid export membrane protein